MELPPVKFNSELYEYIRKARRKDNLVCDLDLLGEGASGTTFTAYMTDRVRFPEPIVLKEQKRNRFCQNEFEALRYLRSKMMNGEYSGYYIFMYGCFISGNKKYLILEKADINLDTFLENHNATPKTFLQIFYHIAQAVSILERDEFNHGDLWNENVMLSWLPDQEDLPEEEREFTVKIIDYDSALKPKSQIKNPSYGGADEYRTKFILGYDLSRFFDAVIYSYDDFVKKKTACKKKRIARLRRQQKKDKSIKIPTLKDRNDIDEDFEADNIVFPQEIVDFMYRLKPNDPSDFNDCSSMSGKAVMRAVIEYATEINIDLGINSDEDDEDDEEDEDDEDDADDEDDEDDDESETSTFIFCGATGADSEWKKYAERGEHEIIEVLPTDSDLLKWKNATITVNKRLQRAFPTKNAYTNKLLMRNIKAADQADAIYAVGFLGDNLTINGGTAWACTYAMMEKKPLWFYEQEKRKWFEYNHNKEKFTFIKKSPSEPNGVWLGIGTRDLNSHGRKAIADLF